MNEPRFEPGPAPAGRAKRRTLVAWGVIVVVAALAITSNACIPPADGDTAQREIEKLLLRIQAQYLIGAGRVAGSTVDVYEQARPLDTGSVAQRQNFVLIAAELAGPAEAGRVVLELDRALLEHGILLAPDEQALQRILFELYTADGEPVADDAEAQAGRAAALSPADRATLEAEAGWLAGAALSPPGADSEARDAYLGAARRLTLTVVGGFFALGLLGLIGVVGIIAAVILAINGKLASGMGSPRPHSGIYAETFAVWFVAFVVFQTAAQLLTAAFPRLGLLAVLGGFLASLIALRWPVHRGIPWKDVRRDVGLTMGRPAWLEPVIGAGGYLSALPLLAVGMLFTLLLLLLQSTLGGQSEPFEPAAGPAHPIVLELVSSGWWLKAQVLFIAAVAAPIVEETMFRGVLYRHMRDASARLGTGISVLVSGTANAFLFAAIHPQGWVAIPALMALAWSFVLLREWRGSLVPSMMVHGISNGLVMLGLLTILGFS